MLAPEQPYTVACVPPYMIEQLWSRVRQYIKEGQHAGDVAYLEDATLTDLHAGSLLLWIAYRGQDIDAAAITQLIKAHSGLQCHLVVAGGQARLRHWPDFIVAIEQYAREQGCVSVRFAGRSGWKKVFAGYVQTGVILERRVSP